MNYAFFSLWLALGFSGWIIACAGQSALQRYENHSGISDGTIVMTCTHTLLYMLYFCFEHLGLVCSLILRQRHPHII